VKRYLAAIRPQNGPQFYEVCFETPPEVQAQVDFARFVADFTDDPSTNRIVWLFSLVLGHSRFMFPAEGVQRAVERICVAVHIRSYVSGENMWRRSPAS
jgi:hypothetical protein